MVGLFQKSIPSEKDAVAKSKLVSRYIGLFLSVSLIGYLVLAIKFNVIDVAGVVLFFSTYYFAYFYLGQVRFIFSRGMFIFISNLLVFILAVRLGRDAGVQYFFISCVAGGVILLEPTERAKIAASIALPVCCYLLLEIFKFDFGITHPNKEVIEFIRWYVIVGPMFLMLFEIALLYLVHFHVETAYKNIIAANRLSSLGQMAGNIAHEMNNPLFVISGQAQLLQKQLKEYDLSAERFADGLQRIVYTCDRMSRTIRGMLQLARKDSSEKFEEIAVAEMVNDVLASCESFLRNRGIEISVNIGSHAVCRCSPTKISQVLINLINNAADAVEPMQDKWIVISARETVRDIFIAISDSGPGISAEIREKIMTPFFTTKGVGKGTGLGLSISKTILESHGGDLFLNDRSRNTQFVMRLPKSPSQQFADTASASLV